MIINMTTQDFSKAGLGKKKKIFSEVLKSKVNQIVHGCMTNGKRGEYRVRHSEVAYSNLKVEPAENDLMEISIYNFETGEWQREVI